MRDYITRGSRTKRILLIISSGVRARMIMLMMLVDDDSV